MRGRWRGLLLAVGLVAFAACPLMFGRSEGVSASPAATVTGTVFQDFNSNGTRDVAVAVGQAIDAGVAGIEVRAFDSTGALVGSTTSAANGTYTLTTTGAATTQVRVEFTIPSSNAALSSFMPSFATTTGASGSTYGSAVQFATLGDTGVNFAVNVPGEFCQNNPNLAVSRQCLNSVTAPSVWVTRYDGGPYKTANGYNNVYNDWSATSAATAGTTGSINGLAWDARSRRVLAAAYVRGLTAIYENPVGTPRPGAIFSTNPTGTKAAQGTGGSTSFLVDLETLMSGDQFSNTTPPASGVANQGFTGYIPPNSSRNLPLGPDSDIPAASNGVYEEVGKTGIGDIDTDGNGNLYVVSLYTRELYRVVLPADASAPTSMTSVGSIVQTVSCTNGTPRPFGVTEWRTNLYMGVVCDGSQDFNIASPNSASDERHMTYSIVRYAPASNTWSTFLGPYPLYAATVGGNFKGSPIMTFNDQSGAINHNSWRWNPWTDLFTNAWESAWAPVYPSPMPTDLQFDRDGSVIVSMRDRTGDRMPQISVLGAGAGVKYPDGTAFPFKGGISGGDVYRICRTGSGYAAADYVWEGGTGCAQSFNNFGFNNNGVANEYYRDDYGKSDQNHGDQSAGMLEYVAGFPEAINTAMDPHIGWTGSAWDITGNTFSSGGLTYYLNSTGDRQTGINSGGGVIFNGEQTQISAAPLSMGDGTFGKVVSMGDVEALCDMAPVQIGDRLWVDTDMDGVQDPDEIPIAGATVRLYDAVGNVVSTAVTNSRGEYLFSSTVTEAANGGASPDATGGNVETGVPYTIRLDNPADYTGSGPLAGYGLTRVDATTSVATDAENLIDSDASMVSGYPRISVPALSPGGNDSSFDFGFAPTVSVGNLVWLDADRDGVQDSGESGIAGVTMTITKADGTAVTDVFGNPVTTTTTDANGNYVFSNLPVGQYKVTATTPSDLVATVDGKGTSSTDSSTGTATSALLSTAGASDTTLDFGFMTPAVSVGDLVWLDADRDGVQDSGESGIAGVTMTITKADGTAVTDVFGNPVTTTTTDANGKYLFENLPVGQYKVTASTPTGFIPTVSGKGTSPTDSSTGSATSTNLTDNGASDLTLDFGFVVPLVSVGDLVWFDEDHDGVQDSDEPGIAGVTLTITRADGTAVTDVFGNPVTTTTTDANGKYLFGNLPPGQYKVTVTPPSGFEATLTGKGNMITDSSTDAASSMNLTENGASDLTLDFGFWKLPTVGPSVPNQDAVTSIGRSVDVDPFKDAIPSRGAEFVEDATRVWDEATNSWSKDAVTADGAWTVGERLVRFDPNEDFIGVTSIVARVRDTNGFEARVVLRVRVRPPLPATGSDPRNILWFGVLLLLIGVMVRRIPRRQRPGQNRRS